MEIFKSIDLINLFTLLIPIIVATIGGMMALVHIRANVISKARIEWIQRLRHSLCDYFEALDTLYFVAARWKWLDDSQLEEERKTQHHVQEIFKAIVQVNKHSRMVELCLNIEETKHLQLISTLDSLDKLVDNYSRPSQSVAPPEIQILSKKVISLSQEILKDAWEDAKKLKVN